MKEGEIPMIGGFTVAEGLTARTLAEIPWFSPLERRAPRKLGRVTCRTETARDCRAPPRGA